MGGSVAAVFGAADTAAAADAVASFAAGAIGTADAVAAGASAADLLAAGASVSDLVAAGASTADLLAAGASVSDLAAAGASASELISAGAPVSDLVSSGIVSDIGGGDLLDAASGQILNSAGTDILSTAAEGLPQASSLTGATTYASGNIIQTFDDGSTLTTDAQGNVIDSTPATDTGTPPTDGTNPLSNPVVQKVGSTLAQKALSSLLAPATKALAAGTPVAGTAVGGLTNTIPATDTTTTNPTTQFLTPSFAGGNANYTLSDNTVSTPTTQPYMAPTDVALMAPIAAPQLATGGQVDVDGETQKHVPEFYSEGGLQHRYVKGAGDGTSDDVPAMLANGEFVIPADVVSSLGNGSNDSGSKVLDNFLETIREHKQKHDAKHLPPDSKGPLAYLLEAHKKVKS